MNAIATWPDCEFYMRISMVPIRSFKRDMLFVKCDQRYFGTARTSNTLPIDEINELIIRSKAISFTSTVNLRQFYHRRHKFFYCVEINFYAPIW